VTRPYAKVVEYRTRTYVIPMCRRHRETVGALVPIKVGTIFVDSDLHDRPAKAAGSRMDDAADQSR
jgi:hypothetical protein